MSVEVDTIGNLVNVVERAAKGGVIKMSAYDGIITYIKSDYCY